MLKKILQYIIKGNIMIILCYVNVITGSYDNLKNQDIIILNQ